MLLGLPTRWTRTHRADLHQQSQSCTRSHISCGTPAAKPREFEWAFGGDTSTFATALGYDAVRVTGRELHIVSPTKNEQESYVVVLNRTAVVVKDPHKAAPSPAGSSSDHIPTWREQQQAWHQSLPELDGDDRVEYYRNNR